ncbi:MAG: YggT family protein [Caldilineaceae bacterium SB0665_bin_21]|nr:YggT family protein [Caldilineaceae bacterium SB0665_bin_21]MYA03968.1 YggT family protein [Caldilineaceae bacterium SB0664_bin_22]
MALLITVLQIYSFLIFIRIMLTWIPNLDHTLAPVQLLCRLTDPVLDLARRYIPPLGMIDVSSAVVLLVLMFVVRALASL